MPLNDPVVIRILVAGKPIRLDLGVRVTSFEYEDSEEEDDLLRVVFADPYNKLIDSDYIVENAEWTVQWGFATKLHAPRKMLVKRPSFRYGEVEVEALDKGSLLKVQENWDVKGQTTIGEVVTNIARKHKLTPVISELAQTLTWFGHGGMTDYEILRYLQSRVDDHIFKVINDELHFKPRNLDVPPIASYQYRPGQESALLSFEIKVKDQDSAKSGKQTSAISIDPKTFRTTVFKADENSTPVTNLGTRRVLDKYTTSYTENSDASTTGARSNETGSSQGQGTGKSLILPPKTKNELESIAKSKRKQSLLDLVQGNFEILASSNDKLYKSGDLIQIFGIGEKFSGNYYIKKISHDLTDGYKYKIEAGRNAVGKTDSKKSGKKSIENSSVSIQNSVDFGRLNGKMNTKVSSLVKDGSSKVPILGSSSLATYGQNGRRV